jgi:hypothetical protein
VRDLPSAASAVLREKTAHTLEGGEADSTGEAEDKEEKGEESDYPSEFKSF